MWAHEPFLRSLDTLGLLWPVSFLTSPEGDPQRRVRYLGYELDNLHEDVQRHIPGHHAAGPFGEKRGGDGYESAGR